MIKASFNANTDGLAGIQELAGNATGLLHERGRPGMPQRLAQTPPAKLRHIPQAPVKIVAADWLRYCLPLRQPWRTSCGILNELRCRLR